MGILYKIVLALYVATYSTMIISSQHENPCENLNGNWVGEFRDSYIGCKWNIVIQAANYKENVQLAVKFTEGGGCINFSANIWGTCSDGMLNMHYFAPYSTKEYPLTGRVFGKLITMEHHSGWYHVDGHAVKM